MKLVARALLRVLATFSYASISAATQSKERVTNGARREQQRDDGSGCQLKQTNILIGSIVDETVLNIQANHTMAPFVDDYVLCGKSLRLAITRSKRFNDSRASNIEHQE